MIEIWKEFVFQSAHRLPKTAPTHKCHSLHGHNFKAIMSFKGPVDENGWLIDYAEISKAWDQIKAVVDHKYLNEISGLENPTSENIAMWLWDRMIAQIPFLVSVELRENDTCGAIYRGTP